MNPTTCECLLLLCCGIAVGLFCWLSYASLSAARRHCSIPQREASRAGHLPEDSGDSVGAAIPG